MAAPKKAREGMKEVLYIRVSADLLNRIDNRVEAEREKQEGRRSVSRADVVRDILYDELGGDE